MFKTFPGWKKSKQFLSLDTWAMRSICWKNKIRLPQFFRIRNSNSLSLNFPRSLRNTRILPIVLEPALQIDINDSLKKLKYQRKRCRYLIRLHGRCKDHVAKPTVTNSQTKTADTITSRPSEHNRTRLKGFQKKNYRSVNAWFFVALVYAFYHCSPRKTSKRAIVR